MTPTLQTKEEPWTKELPTEPGLYDVDMQEFDGAYWPRQQVSQIGKKLFFTHPKTGKQSNLKGLIGAYYWRKCP